MAGGTAGGWPGAAVPASPGVACSMYCLVFGASSLSSISTAPCVHLVYSVNNVSCVLCVECTACHVYS